MIPEPGTKDFRRWALRWPRGLIGHPSRIHLRGDTALVLHFDGADPPEPFARPARVAVASSSAPPVRNAIPVERVPLRSLRPWRPSPLRELRRVREAVLDDLEHARLGPTMAAVRGGARLFHVSHSVGATFPAPAHAALMLVGLRSLRSALARIPGVARAVEQLLDFRLETPPLTLRSARRAAFAALRSSTAALPPDDAGAGPRPLAVTHYIGTLGSGGAERQLTYLASTGVARGDRHDVLTMLPLEGDMAHYLPALERGGVPVRTLECTRRTRRLPEIERLDGVAVPAELVRRLDGHPMFSFLVASARALVDRRPDVVHAWLDAPNVVGALSALAIGVPRILLSTRNLSPPHFPRLERSWFRDAYRVAALSPRVRFIANSRAGAKDYADWLGLPVARFEVIYNGLPTEGLEPPSEEERRRRRAELGIDPGTVLAVAVFRLAAEKRPADFLETVARALREEPRLRVLHLGTGPDQDEVRARARTLGLDERLRFLGAVANPALQLGVADLSILTSGGEGCPNVALEAQALGVPMIVTRAGGAPETVLDGESGLVCEVGDVAGLAGAMVELARDPDRRRHMGERGARFVRERFSLDGMVDRTYALYREAPDGGA